MLFSNAAEVSQGAVLSACGRYRYRLWRQWGAGGTCVWVMLNPSTADADRDDPTIRKCVGFARRWGYGGIEVVNLCAWRATDPRELFNVPHPTSEPHQPRRNFVAVEQVLEAAKIVVAAWGVPGGEFAQATTMLDTFKARWPAKLRVIGFNAGGTPKHPLMVPYSALPVMVVQ